MCWAVARTRFNFHPPQVSRTQEATWLSPAAGVGVATTSSVAARTRVAAEKRIGRGAGAATRAVCGEVSALMSPPSHDSRDLRSNRQNSARDEIAECRSMWRHTRLEGERISGSAHSGASRGPARHFMRAASGFILAREERRAGRAMCARASQRMRILHANARTSW
jgi:hypothetical protein